MLLKLVFETTTEVDVSVLDSFSDKLSDYFKAKTYGSGVDSLIITVTCVSPMFDSFCVLQKPKYSKPGISGDKYGFGKTLSLNIKLNYEQYTRGSDMVKIELLSSQLRQLTTTYAAKFKTIKDFDAVGFESDIKLFFQY